ncbi:hypothetical protein HNY73_021599 [Argiope bruennichi]|uniref:Uncharacterized protein n=1 Tax=Argiope bruennichi TaxID=94029 RepID=A0A8T0DY48_ARGBR|nr:hypothetical protein HNY73_021599 [Argiope bruennichi]
MALCVMNPVETRDSNVNKYALKLLGISNKELTDEEILECLSMYIKPSSIEALLFDSFNNFYVLFLNNIDSTCRLVGKTLEFQSHCIDIYPLLDCFLIDNVYPCIKNDELRDIFRAFGNVFTVSNHHIVPNSSKFSHVLSGKREITFLLPGKESSIYIPLNVVHSPYSFHVRKFCCACLTEGHSVLHCPDIEHDEDMQKIKHDDNDSGGELDFIIKSEDINLFEDYKVEDPVPESQSAAGTSKESKEPPQDMPENNIVNTKKGNETKPDDVAMTASQEVNTKKSIETKPDDVPMNMSQEGKHKKQKIDNGNDLTKVVSSSSVCRFSSKFAHVVQHTVRKSMTVLPPLAEELINEVCGTCIIEANVIKQMVVTDGRWKSEIIKFAFNYVESLVDLLKFLKQIMKRCRKDEKYVCLQGPFTNKRASIDDFWLNGTARAPGTEVFPEPKDVPVFCPLQVMICHLALYQTLRKAEK